MFIQVEATIQNMRGYFHTKTGRYIDIDSIVAFYFNVIELSNGSILELSEKEMCRVKLMLNEIGKLSLTKDIIEYYKNMIDGLYDRRL